MELDTLIINELLIYILLYNKVRGGPCKKQLLTVNPVNPPMKS